MSADRELLELAAKAAEIDGCYADIHPELGDEWEESGIWYCNPNDCTDCWNPLTYDGDALRLAVKLELTVDIRPLAVCIFRKGKQYPSFVSNEGESDLTGATRRAITRAAAEIGRAMP